MNARRNHEKNKKRKMKNVLMRSAGSYRRRHAITDRRCGNSTTLPNNGTKVQVWTCNNQTNQDWAFYGN